MSDTRVSDALFMFATPHHWVCRRCNKHDEVNCYCGYYQGPLKSTEPYSHPKNQPWAIASDVLQIARELEQQVESLRAELIAARAAPDNEAWQSVVKYAYAEGGDGARNIQSITSHYIAMRVERDALLADKERLVNPMLIALEIAQSSLEKQIGGSAALEIVTLAIDAARKPVSQEPAK